MHISAEAQAPQGEGPARPSPQPRLPEGGRTGLAPGAVHVSRSVISSNFPFASGSPVSRRHRTIKAAGERPQSTRPRLRHLILTETPRKKASFVTTNEHTDGPEGTTVGRV